MQSSSQKPFLALSSGAATTEVAAEQLTAGAGQQEGHVDTVVKSCQALEIYVFIKNIFLKLGFQKGRQASWIVIAGHHSVPSLSAMVFSCPGGAFF